MDQIALDIETIPTVENPDFDDETHWIPFCIALGHHESSMGNPEVDVLFREDPSLRAEARLLDDMIDWIATRTNASDREIITYNGENYDFPILKHRARVTRHSHPDINPIDRLQLLIDTSSHTDLIRDMHDREGHWVSLDDALDMHNINTDNPEWFDTAVSGSDMPSMGLELLSNRPNDDLREVVRRYAASDVKPLFDLHDSLRNDESDRIRDQA